MKNDILKTLKDILVALLNKPNAIGTSYVTLSVTADTAFTAPATGTLIVTATTNQGVNMAPYLSLQNSSGYGFTGVWGIITSDAVLVSSITVKKGVTYKVHPVRCSITSARIYT